MSLLNMKDRRQTFNKKSNFSGDTSNTLWKSFESKDSDQTYPYEFTPEVQELIDRGIHAKLNRKSFLTVMGASLAMAAMNCHRRPVEKIIPYVQRPDNHVPGIASYYATAYVNPQGVLPLVVKTREGKPIKVEGNEEHPITQGAMTAEGYATIWDMYDPDRLKSPFKRSGKSLKKISWGNILKEIQPKLKKGMYILTRSSYSPSETQVRVNFSRKYSARVITYDPVGTQNEVLSGQKRSYGVGSIPYYRFDEADLILSIEADFLGTWLSSEVYSRQFSSRRNPDKNMNRLVSVESMMSVTGANSDRRIAIKAGSHLVFVMGLARQILPHTIYSGRSDFQSLLEEYTPSLVSQVCGIEARSIKSLADELLAHKGRCLVVAGSGNALQEEKGALHYSGNLLNAMLQNQSNTIITQTPLKDKDDLSSHRDIRNLLNDMSKNKVKTLIIDRANPMYDFPQISGFKEALKKVENVIVIASHKSETVKEAHYVLPVSHFMESWGDGYAYGTYNIVQPVIRPLFDTRSAGDIWLLLQNRPVNFYQFIKDSVSKRFLAGTWEEALSAGYSQKIRPPARGLSRNFKTAYLFKIIIQEKYPRKDFSLNLYENLHIKDGSGGNISFRQELPDPITKVTWGNFLAVSPEDAYKYNWKTGDNLLVTMEKNRVELPIFVQPGLAQGSVALAFGYGHTALGRVAKGVGFNAWELASFNELGIRHSGIHVELKKIPGRSRIATTQKHHSIPGPEKRGIANITELSEYIKDKKAGHTEFNQLEPGTAKLPGKGLYPEYEYKSYRWGMNIDLSKCTGCSACVVSCYSENNIPAVGKKEVLVGREMSWIRIDRYYRGDLTNPDVIFQPVMCQHCENAPCENVCPVAATSHSPEGLNDMSYNRCIGTRYCLNNCPYKVRRFNWFENWENKIRDPLQYSLNPDVTVRSRGVIEKCSFCVQRISEKRQQAKLENRKIKDQELKTACQQGCPTKAISFGNINDEKSEVSQKQKEDRSYRVLLHTNVKPSVTYMTKIKNTGGKG